MAFDPRGIAERVYRNTEPGALPGSLTVTKVLSSNDFKTMYTTPIEILPAPGAGKMYLVDEMQVRVDYNSAASAAGGLVVLQYGTTAAGAGTAIVTVAAATFNAVAADSIVRAPITVGATPASVANTSICLSNQTAVFTTTDAVYRVTLTYQVTSF